MGRTIFVLFIISALGSVLGQEDSLRSALNAISRRQKDLSDYDDNEYGYTLERPDDVSFLKPAYPDRSYSPAMPMANYLDDREYDQEKRVSSPFRERVEKDNQQQLEEIAENLVSNMDSKGGYNFENEEYEELLRELWDKYRRPYDHRMYLSKADKRVFYPRLGYDSIGLRKRDDGYGDPYFSDSGDDEEDEDYPTNSLRKRYNQRNTMHRFYPHRYAPMAKRSSDYTINENLHEHKRSAPKKQTDPKVERDLSNIFGGKKMEVTTEPLTATDQIVARTDNATTTTDNKTATSTGSRKVSTEKPLQIKKKSIDWSEYFGLDRRKKSSTPDDLDKEWLIKRYHKSIALSTKKRNAGLPLSSFRKHDELSEIETDDNKKIDDMDKKLKILEDKIVDDALKYTGAHEGDTSYQKLQETKARVISRLAAAYNIEKMRNAISEYRSLLTKNKNPTENYNFLEEKRNALPRKSALDQDRDSVLDADNNIKCAEGNLNCHEQNYKTPTEIIENHFGTEGCSAIERACNDVALIIGEFGRQFITACNMHQMCLLCSNNSWYSPTRQCNALFIAKAYDLCKGSIECQKEAQRSLRYLLDVNRSLYSQPSAVNDCELSCPDSDVIYDPNSR